MLSLLGRLDALLHTPDTHDRQHRHHLFLIDKQVVRIRLGK